MSDCFYGCVFLSIVITPIKKQMTKTQLPNWQKYNGCVSAACTFARYPIKGYYILYNYLLQNIHLNSSFTCSIRATIPRDAFEVYSDLLIKS